MTDQEQNAQWRDEVLQHDVLPLYFQDAEPEDSPELVLLAGQPGAGRLRATAAADLAGMAVINADELQAFHPQYARLRASRAPEDAAELAQTAAGWVAGCIRHARENRHSVVIDGAFPDPAVAAAAAERFAAAGFATRVVFVGSSRAESLLTVTSGYLQDVRARRPSAVVTRAAHNAGLEATRQLAASLEASGWVDRATIVSRVGRVTFDARRTEGADGFAGVSAALVAAQSERLNRWDATQWLSELHHVTDFATALRTMPDTVGELLVDLHETALREVIPGLHVPTDSTFRPMIEDRTRARLADLQQARIPEPAVDAAAPVLVPGSPDTSGPTR